MSPRLKKFSELFNKSLDANSFIQWPGHFFVRTSPKPKGKGLKQEGVNKFPCLSRSSQTSRIFLRGAVLYNLVVTFLGDNFGNILQNAGFWQINEMR